MFPRRRKKLIRKLLSRILTIFIILVVILSVIALLYPLDYVEYIKKYSVEYDIDPLLVASIINVESKYKKDAVSHKDARGLMQIGPTTGNWAGEELDIENYNENMLFIPEINIRIGTWYLAKLNSEFGDNLDLILAAYNAGSGNVQKWISDPIYSEDGINLDKIPFKETAEYLIKVRANLRIYNLVYNNKLSNSEGFGTRYFDFMNGVRMYLFNINDSYSEGDVF